MRLSDILTTAYPGQQWSLEERRGESPDQTYARLVWIGPAAKPTLAEIIAAEPTPQAILDKATAASKAAAKAAMIANTPDAMATRVSQRVSYKATKAVMQSFNALRLHISDPVNNPLPPALPIRTWKQVLDAARAECDAETDPDG